MVVLGNDSSIDMGKAGQIGKRWEETEIKVLGNAADGVGILA